MSVQKNVFINCMNHIPVGCIAAGSAIAGADTDVNMINAGPYSLEYYNIAATTGQFIPRRVVDANCCNGWEMPYDQTADEGQEMGFGILADSDRIGAYKVGTDPGFFFEVKFGIPIVADYDIAGIGFRKAAAYVSHTDPAANFGTAVQYTDFAYLYSNAGDIYSAVAKNQTGGGTGTGTITDTTDNWVDNAVKSLRLSVSGAGVVSFTIDGAAPTAGTHALTFDTDDILIPSIIFNRQQNGAASAPIVEHIKLGYTNT